MEQQPLDVLPLQISVPHLNVIWLSAAGCDGCSMATFGAAEPSLEGMLAGGISDLPPVTIVHPLISLESGDEYRAHLEEAARGELHPFVLVVEGSLMNEALAGAGSFSRLGTSSGGRALTSTWWFEQLAPQAAAVVGVGSCATWGGIPAAEGNPTGAHGLEDHLGGGFRSSAGLPVVNVPGCAPPGEVIVETLISVFLHLLGRVPLELDENNQPRWVYGDTATPCPPRTGYMEAGARRVTVGCPVPTHGWMRRIGGCERVGGACIGCTARGFADTLLQISRPHRRER